MSSNDSSGSEGDAGPGTREIAHRLFATEFDAASLEYADSDEERAPKYVITPAGARVNRLFVVGVLTEVERVNDDVVRARVVDPTGAFVVYAGQYQPDALAFLEQAAPPMFVAVTGKANTFQPEDSDRVYTSVRPESIAEVDAETRDRWTVRTAEHTLRRVSEFAAALDGGETAPASGIALAREEYGTTPTYLSAIHDTALDAARLVAGEVEEVSPPGIAPGEDDGRAVELGELSGGVGTSAPAADAEAGDEPVTAETEADESPASSTTEPPAPDSEPESEPEPDTAAEVTADIESDDRAEEVEPADETEPIDEAASSGSAGQEERTVSETSEREDEDGSDGLGGFGVEETEPAATEAEPESAAGGGADEDELYEFDPEERAEIEAEFDMGFSSGNEVEEPGEADIDAPEPEIDDEKTPSETSDPASEPEAVEPEADTEAEPRSEPATADDGNDPSDDEDADVEDRAMAVMAELADGDGADREEVIDRVASETGVAPEEVDDAIESALLSGRCYEPQDDVLKPI